MKPLYKWLLGILGLGAVAFGADIIINPLPTPNPDQAIYDTIKNAELNGTVPNFVTTPGDVSALTERISAQVAKRSIELGSYSGNLYLKNRAALQAQGVQVMPVSQEITL